MIKLCNYSFNSQHLRVENYPKDSLLAKQEQKEKKNRFHEKKKNK